MCIMYSTFQIDSHDSEEKHEVIEQQEMDDDDEEFRLHSAQEAEQSQEPQPRRHRSRQWQRRRQKLRRRQQPRQQEEPEEILLVEVVGRALLSILDLFVKLVKALLMLLIAFAGSLIVVIQLEELETTGLLPFYLIGLMFTIQTHMQRHL